jgi:hypothetical protein
MKSPRHYLLIASTALLTLGSLCVPVAHAGTPDAKATPEVAPPPPDNFFHALLQLDFGQGYITPRGLYVTNQGLSFQPLFLTFWDVYHSKDGFLNDVTLTLGVWSDFDTHESGVNPSHYNEFDPIAGIAWTFGDWKLDTNFTAFDSIQDDYPTSAHLQVQLTYDDSKALGAFALHPYVAYWQELHEKATVNLDPATSAESGYFTFGVSPSAKVGPVKFELPMYINVVRDKFYQQFDGSPGGSGLAVFGAELKASVPLTFIPKDMGSWTLYAGVKYYHLNNDGLIDGNIALNDESKTNLFQFHAGISIFF